MGKCFIIMPITTPHETVARYLNDQDHFKHVLEHLFIPAIIAAGHEPIPPQASGADLIHAEIVRHLESDDLALCDMSTLNANVFFELGVRTAVDRPICLVRDNLTEKIPFDTGLLNHHTYDPSLAPWRLSNEIVALSEHIIASVNRSNGKNPMWQQFGLSKRAVMGISETPMEQKLDLILSRLDTRDKQGTTLLLPTAPPSKANRKDIAQWIVMRAQEIAAEVNAGFDVTEVSDTRIKLNLRGFMMAKSDVEQIVALAKDHGVEVIISGGTIIPVMDMLKKDTP